jgi:hypothetical protein
VGGAVFPSGTHGPDSSKQTAAPYAGQLLDPEQPQQLEKRISRILDEVLTFMHAIHGQCSCQWAYQVQQSQRHTHMQVTCWLVLINALASIPAGETFHQAASRGLQEELGITAVVPQQPLGSVHRRSLEVPGLYTDNELVQSYRVDGFDGQVCVKA